VNDLEKAIDIILRLRDQLQALLVADGLHERDFPATRARDEATEFLKNLGVLK
jgi:hypothetical protein